MARSNGLRRVRGTVTDPDRRRLRRRPPIGSRCSTTTARSGREKPVYFQLLFAVDRGQGRWRPDHPSGRTSSHSVAALEGRLDALAASGGEHGLLELVMAILHASGHDDRGVRGHRPRVDPKYGAPPALRPTVHGLSSTSRCSRCSTYLRANGLQDVHRVGRRCRVHAALGPRTSTGSRPWSRSSGAASRRCTKCEIRGRTSRSSHGSPRSTSFDDKAGSPSPSHKFIGRRPLIAFGNSDGDLQMLEWTTMPAPGVTARRSSSTTRRGA